MRLRQIFFSLAFLGSVCGLRAGETNRFNLSEEQPKPRFPLTDKKWPEKVGEADLCLWRDDKLAALSLGVDDNTALEIDWWKEQAKTYDFKVTWFVITGRVDANRATGFWDQFRELNALGHGVESHSVTHLHMDDPNWGNDKWTYTESVAATQAARAAVVGLDEDGKTAARTEAIAKQEKRPVEEIKQGIAWEYAKSKAQLDANIPGHTASALAYPGGIYAKFHDRNLAGKVYRVARGARASANPANAIDYLSVNAQSSWNFGDSKYGWGNVYNILDPNLYAGRYYRGWAVLFTHSANKPLMEQTFNFIEKNRENLWLGLFVDVAKYGQERDTATLKVESPGPEKITFLLTDEMDDSYFNYPLTIKVRIPDAWKEAAATQAGQPVAVKILEHEGGAYALVQAVPDAGLVTLTKK